MDDKTLLALVDKFSSSELSELELSDGSTKLVLRKASAQMGSPTDAAQPGAHAQAGAPSVHLGLPVPAAEAVASGKEQITSPIVATFYRSPGPDAPAFVEVGTKVKAGQTLCILEAMKMMNHLEAEFDCEIVAVKAQSGDLVEYGQVLFEVKRS
jgi:acetyl-CoA carboxylase biotin carboxyl carrier protein